MTTIRTEAQQELDEEAMSDKSIEAICVTVGLLLGAIIWFAFLAFMVTHRDKDQ